MSFNPFENEIENTNTKKEITEINIETIVIKGKRATLLYGWIQDKDELKSNMKILKSKLGCNGTIKKTEEGELYLQLSGNKSYELYDYLVKKGIDENIINIKN